MNRFQDIKKTVGGRLSTETYAALYEAGAKSSPGNILEIGAATGAGTIALALGLKETGKDSLITAIEKGYASDSLKYGNDIERNAWEIDRNLTAYSVDNYVRLLMGRVKDVYQDVPKELVGILIDADGALDRDLSFFHNRLMPGSFVILDDYENRIREHERQRNKEKYLSGVSLEEICPLGKHYTTFQFCEYLLGEGVIIKERVIGNTLFARKGRDFTNADYRNMREIRKQIALKFMDLWGKE